MSMSEDSIKAIVKAECWEIQKAGKYIAIFLTDSKTSWRYLLGVEKLN